MMQTGAEQKKSWSQNLSVWFSQLVLPGFQGIPVSCVMKLFGESLVKGILFQRAAAMTYRFFVAFIPMVMAVFSILSFTGTRIQTHIMNVLHTIVPRYAWPVAEQMINEVVERQNRTMLWVFLAVGLYFSVIAINSFLNSLRSSYFEVPIRNLFKQLFLSLEIFFIFVTFLIIIVFVFIITSKLIQYIDENTFNNTVLYTYTVGILRWLLVFASLYILISLLYYVVPAKKTYYRIFSAGSSVATILIILILSLIDFYFSSFADYTFIFGSMGAILAVLMWVYLNSVAVLVGFDLNVSIAKAKTEIMCQSNSQNHGEN